ncbi:MAG: flagellar biosynthesis protein FlhF [Pseudomonadota bacterium]
MVKKFHAATTREALRLVRDALGANAIILSNRQVEGGVEIIAVADLDMAALTEQAEPVRMPARRPAPAAPTPSPRTAPPPLPEPALTTLADFLAQREGSVLRPSPTRKSPPTGSTLRPAKRAPAWSEPARPEPAWQEAPEPAPFEPSPPRRPAATPPPTARASDNEPVMRELAQEMRMLRALVEGQLAGLAWNDACRREPHRAEIMKHLMAAGFSPALSRQILDRMPAQPDPLRALRWVQAALTKNLRVASPADDLVDRGGIFALVGPTGVGKTTTVAKLAARAVLKHGAGRVAMITTDSYRIGAQDQLRIYGRILGAPVFAARDENDLELTLLDLQDKHLVFIDTIGMSQKDRRVGEQTEMLAGPDPAVRRLLLLGAPAQGITLEEVVRAYRGPGLAGCILTKIDEAQTFGPALDVMIRHQLPVHYVTNGQRVPEDMHLANARYLIDRAFKLAAAGASGPFQTSEEDYPVLMAAAEQRAGLPDADPGYPAQGALGVTA